MALKRFVKSSATGDKFPTGDNLNRPCWVQPLEKFTGLITEYDPEGENVVLRAHVYDLESDQAYARVVFFNGALVDGLGQDSNLGEEMVVRFADIRKKSDPKKTFRGVLDGTDADYEMAEGKIDQIHKAIAARLEELDAGEGGPVESAPKQDAAQAAKVAGAFSRK